MKFDELSVTKKLLEAQASKMEKTLFENGITDVKIEVEVRNKSDAEFLLRGPEGSVLKAKQILDL